MHLVRVGSSRRAEVAANSPIVLQKKWAQQDNTFEWVSVKLGPICKKKNNVENKMDTAFFFLSFFLVAAAVFCQSE